MDFPITLNVDNETTMYINKNNNKVSISILKETEKQKLLIIRSVEEIVNALTNDIKKVKLTSKRKK